jgi:negative regulator of flagellin synthesis FlgM
MEISDKNQNVVIDAYVNQVQTRQKTAPLAGKTGGEQGIKEDTVVISDAARLIQEAQKQLQSVPDVRMEKVMDLRSRIESGVYEIKPDAIAGKMIQESLLNDLFK